MAVIDPVIVNLAVALGIGLLIGAERERRKGTGPSRSPAGIRTFAAASLMGAVSFLAGGELLFGIVTAGTIGLTGIAYFRSRSSDPGLTSEIVLVLAVLLGGLTMQKPGLAAGLAVVVTGLLVARTALHRFARSVLTEAELEDAVIHELERYMRCKDCSQVRGYPFKRNLIALRPTKISASAPPSTWRPGER